MSRNLPAPGTSPDGVAQYVDSLVYESATDSRRMAWLREAERNYQLYIGEHWTTSTPEGEIRVILNRTQNAIVSLVSLQAADPPKLTFTPRESGDPALFYLNTELPEHMALAAQLGVDPTTGMYPNPEKPGEFRTLQDPLPDSVGKRIEVELELAKLEAQTFALQGLPSPVPPPPEDLLIKVDDSTSARALQTVFDAQWEVSDAQWAFTENVQNKNIFGWQPELCEFDDEEKRHIFTNLHPKHCFPDPLNSDPKRWAYCVIDRPIGVDEAVRTWPHLSQTLMDVARVGTLTFPGSRNYPTASMFDNRYEREMVVVRTAWIRHQRYPMSRDEAIKKQKVAEVDIPTGQMTEGPPEMMQVGTGNVDEMGNEVMEEVPTGITTLVPETRKALMMGEQEVDEASPAWPQRFGIRQITIIAGTTEVVDDRECEYDRIPICINKNVPIPFSTYGQGEPKRLEGLQMSINRVLSAFVTHHAYNAYPPELIAESVVEQLGKELQDSRTKPGQRLTIPDALLIQLGTPEKIVMNMETGQMAADFWRLLDLLVQYVDMEGNQADVIQGEAAAGWSGKTVESLQSAANQVIRGKAIYTEFFLKDRAHLMVYNIAHRMEEEDWKRSMSRYPIQALRALRERAKSIDIDIAVEITSGSGHTRQGRTANLIAAQQAGIPVSPQTIMEGMDIDPDTEVQQNVDWAKKMAASGTPSPMPGGALPAPGQGEEEPGKQRVSDSGGNGGNSDRPKQ